MLRLNRWNRESLKDEDLGLEGDLLEDEERAEEAVLAVMAAVAEEDAGADFKEEAEGEHLHAVRQT